MSEPIYSIYIVHSFREAYYQLSAEGKGQFWAKVDETGKTAGSTSHLVCRSQWSNERYVAWGLEEFPDLASIQLSVQTHEDNEHYRYLEAETCLGSKIGGKGIEAVDFPNPLYQLWLVKNINNDPWESLSKADRDRIWEQMGASIDKNGGVEVLTCESTWSNEEYSAFGVLAWPSLEAQQAHSKELANIGWYRYIYTKIILGTRL